MKKFTINTTPIQVKHLFTSLGLLAMFITLFAGCKRETAVEGPELNDLFGEFTVLDDFASSAAAVDFSTGEEVHFTARFSTITDWTLTIKSQTSAAVKVISGRSKVLDASNAMWDGTTTVFPTFGTGPCSASLFLLSDSSTHTTTVSVTGVRTTSGVVVADFESGINPKWDLFVQSGADMTFRIEDTEVVPEGSSYFDMAGEVNWDWLIGLINFPATAQSSESFELSANPNDEYFNVLLNRPEAIINGVVLFQFKEDENGDGTFTEANEDMYAIELKNLDAGWQIVSVKYADLQSLVDGVPAPAKGNAQHNPDKLHTISCLFLANPSSGFSQTLMDYVIFTNGEPLKM